MICVTTFFVLTFDRITWEWTQTKSKVSSVQFDLEVRAIELDRLLYFQNKTGIYGHIVADRSIQGSNIFKSWRLKNGLFQSEMLESCQNSWKSKTNLGPLLRWTSDYFSGPHPWSRAGIFSNFSNHSKLKRVFSNLSNYLKCEHTNAAL